MWIGGLLAYLFLKCQLATHLSMMTTLQASIKKLWTVTMSFLLMLNPKLVTLLRVSYVLIVAFVQVTNAMEEMRLSSTSGSMALTGKWCLSAVFHHHGCLKFATQLTLSTLTDTQKAQSPCQCLMMTNSVTLLIFEIIFFLIIKNGSQIHDGDDVLNGQKWRQRYAIQSRLFWNVKHDGNDGKSSKRP